jgi:hypothetical protein
VYIFSRSSGSRSLSLDGVGLDGDASRPCQAERWDWQGRSGVGRGNAGIPLRCVAARRRREALPFPRERLQKDGAAACASPVRQSEAGAETQATAGTIAAEDHQARETLEAR